ncbi:ABC transporter substrate-binding protein [Pseudorhodoferax sp.]|uniref:ABC transporter substrate-binding protein n=1 Tax=Pseudorhodoferax sp. TaxID=1993553 RepID=UPI0039E480C1
MAHRRAVLRAGAAAGAALLGLPARAAPLVLHDALGRRVEIAAPPQRIVTIFSSNTELVAALGLVDRIVGVEDYTRFPPEVLHLPKVGGRLGFSADAVVAQRPDLVIVTPARQAAHQLVAPMERIGVPVLVLLSRTLDEVIGNLRLVAQAAGVPGRGEALAGQLQARLARVQARVAARPAPSLLMLTGRLGNGMLLTARADSYTGEAMLRAGGRLALAGPLAQVSPEAALAADPDVLLFAGSGPDLQDLVRQPGWRDMRAVRGGRAATVARSEFLIPGPRTFDGIEKLAQWLHPA